MDSKRLLRAAILVISDSAHAGVRSDKSGQIVREFLEKEPVTDRALRHLAG